MATAASDATSIPLEESIPKVSNSVDQLNHSRRQDQDNVDSRNFAVMNIDEESINTQPSNSMIERQNSRTPSVDYGHPSILASDCSPEEIIAEQPGSIRLQPITSNSRQSPMRLPSPTIESRSPIANEGNRPATIDRK